MAAWGNICRVCSSPADHEIFAKIPTFLHANCNEFLKWQKPINELIEETTGIKIAPDDGLPKNICELCVSYLKHAVNFREQCINNALSFNLVLKYKKLQRTESEAKESDKDSYLISEQDLDYSSQRELEMVNFLSNNTFQEQNKVNKAMFDQTMPSNFCQQLDYLNTLFDKKCSSRRKSNYPKHSSKTNATRERNDEDFHTASSSDEAEDVTAVSMPTKVDIFSYKEKSFIEDDVLNILEVQQSVAINVPDSSQERKCKACLRRFMFNESFEQHKNECIELRLVKFIEEVNNLNSSVRMDISPHEFIRRMIFALRKICEWLMSYHSDITLPDLPQYTQVRQTSTESQTDSDSKNQDSSLKGISPILEPTNTSTKRSVFSSSQNILCEIERCESQNSQKSALASNSSGYPANARQKPSYAESRTLKNRDRDRSLTNLLKDDISSKLPRINPFKLNCTARCQPCGLAFETLVAFEVHNALHHNYNK